MGVVHLAVVQALRALKSSSSSRSSRPCCRRSPSSSRCFSKRRASAARLNHPNIVQTNEVGSEGDVTTFAMDTRKGRTFGTLLKAVEGGPALPLTVHLHILIDALAGLHHAHQLTAFAGKP